MALDEAIKHCLEVAEENDLAAGTYELLAENNHNAYEKLTAETNSSRCAECAADHRQLAEWLTELKQWRRVYGVCPSYEMCIPECKEGYNAQIAEYKRLLKAAVEDFTKVPCNNDAYNPNSCGICVKQNNCNYSDSFKWRYADEALALIGEDTNVPASADDTNIGHKSGGWISVKDRLPESGKEVLVWYRYTWGAAPTSYGFGINVWHSNKKQWREGCLLKGVEVLYWQPLPEPPKDGEQND